MQLRRLYFTYKVDVLEYHHKELLKSGISPKSIPKASLSQASQGNVLEVLNMALNGEYVVYYAVSFSILLILLLIGKKSVK